MKTELEGMREKACTLMDLLRRCQCRKFHRSFWLAFQSLGSFQESGCYFE